MTGPDPRSPRPGPDPADNGEIFCRGRRVRFDSAAEFLERFSLDPIARIRTLSRGLKLKLEMAAALASKPTLLVLDDPTSGLEAVSTKVRNFGAIV